MHKAQNADEYIAKQRMALASNSECGATHYNLAVALMGQKKYEEAESHLHEAISCSPNLAEAFVQLGAICLQRGDEEGCLHYNKRSIKARAGFSPGYANIGYLELQNGNIDEAVKHLRKSIVFNSKNIQAFTTLATAYLMQGLLDEAIEACRQAIEINPDFPISYNNLAVAYLEKGDYDQAIENADKAESLGYPLAEGLKKELDSHRKNV
ncbi:tetratricopeptide repeat protein [Desulfobotulus alkaliphilus]|uniref:Tetratricopeptide repeat protein n=1 Tax=Desulfobotulus alkaliphilus TaxID=622671 RepID=A0A562S2Y7_9BACT|nr:tetratricopeptide repeat protein [Desulfobotulus alkaliphilus]TWI75528.1 tetratricopeptide repeat protein [Desulfobotulus alkaliphilus]